ncbi:FeoB-associated Cys-rich membrane protein [Roseburia sp. AM59-24XD]|uniref:FeoB-associated Cys-rich membrane protein n=1 Tax=Roseburia sp. AM59-24XD TaxID=2293138 RepID=UPI000E5217DC|nr:FeoB-associated Cys-rich membrane protein [Roseburia sp. AM59-24XD]
MLANVIVIALLVLIVGSAVLYIRKEKKRGVHCIGCPSAGSCSRSCMSNQKKHAKK